MLVSTGCDLGRTYSNLFRTSRRIGTRQLLFLILIGRKVLVLSFSPTSALTVRLRAKSQVYMSKQKKTTTCFWLRKTNRITDLVKVSSEGDVYLIYYCMCYIYGRSLRYRRSRR